MLLECQTVVRWWGSRLRLLDGVNDAIADSFETSLLHELLSRFDGHWHVGNAEKGSAYRSIANDPGRIDPVLLSAALQSGLRRSILHQLLSSVPSCIMFCNPGQVRLRYNGGVAMNIFSSKAPVLPLSPGPIISPASSSHAKLSPKPVISCKRQARYKPGNSFMLSPFLH